MPSRKDREERLALALRENLKRRKAQQRERTSDGPGEAAPVPPAPDDGNDGDD